MYGYLVYIFDFTNFLKENCLPLRRSLINMVKKGTMKSSKINLAFAEIASLP